MPHDADDLGEHITTLSPELVNQAIGTASVRDLATTAGVGPVIPGLLKRIVSGGEP
jgi:hypothetical protein